MDTMTLELRRNTRSWHLPVIDGEWYRKDQDTISATYDAEALAYALACVGQTGAALRLLVDSKRARQLQHDARQLRGL